MTKKIFRSIFLVVVVVFFALLILITGVLYDYFSEVQMNQLMTETALCASAVESEGMDYLNSLPDTSTRITWLSENGTVLFDSKAETGTMVNHLEREEIAQALENGEGKSLRYSDARMERQLYSAKRLPDGTILLLSSTQLALWSLVFSMLQPILLTMVIAIFFSMYLAYRLAKRIVQPLNELDLNAPETENTYEELTPLVNRIASQQKQLNLQKEKLKLKQEEFYTATNSMNEGIILLTKSGSLLSINQAASKLLGISTYCIGKDLLLFNSSMELQELIRLAGQGEHTERMMPLNGRNYQFNASAIFSGTDVSGIALIIFDITEKEKAEEVRREFTANVSHELKTPLQVISGSAELLANGMVEDHADVMQFAAKIHAEALRMIALVEDIIKLSHLDEGAEDMKRQTVDLYALAELTVRNLKPVAQRAGIVCELTGASAEMYGIPQLLSGILYNLCDNAVKYNCKGGTVHIDVKTQDETVILSVSDDGIGIPEDEQARVFERFYRVDKSRSKSAGGTGLGLSIVKHSVLLHDGTITMQSSVGIGTTITIVFPNALNCHHAATAIES